MSPPLASGMYALRMTANRQNPPAECSGQCDRCGLQSVAGDVNHGQHDMAGWRLVWRSGAVFLLPMLAAATGAAVAHGSPARQLAGAIAGFAAGVLVAVVGTRSARP